MAKGQYRSFHLPESKAHYPRDRELIVEHLKVGIALDFEARRLTGRCELKVKPVRDGLKSMRLDAVAMDIAGVTVDGAPRPFAYDGETLTLSEERGWAGTHVVDVDYSTSPPEAVYFVAPDKEHPEKPTQAWTQNESDYARYWIPCVDDPSVKSATEVAVKVPKGFVVISNGVLASTEEGDGTVTFRWKEDLPHPSYLVSFIAGRFEVLEQEARGVPLTYYFPEEKRADVLRYFGETPRMIEVFEDATGVKYPYAKYAQTTVEDFIFGGMENFNATTLATSYYPDASSEEDFQVSYSSPHTNAVNLVAHELAHQWFGDLVTCSDWSHAWLNEGFATFMQNLYIEKTRGDDESREDMDAKAEEFFEEDADEYRRAIVDREYVYPDDLFDHATYLKGSWMIRQLRYVVGDVAFFAGVGLHLKRHSFGNADTHDFRRSMEEASGVSLEEHFEQSFYRPGYPEFEVEYAWDPAAKLASFRVRQTQKPDLGTPVFKLPCDLVMYVRGKRVSRRVEIVAQDQTFTFSLEEGPTIVEFDPQHWLLKKVKFSKTIGMLLEQLKSSEDASSRADAAGGLSETKSNLAIAGLKEAAMKEQFWHVRARAIRALGEIGSDEAFRGLGAVGLPQGRRVRRSVAEALGRFKAPEAKEKLLRLLQTDESPYVRCEAALALSKNFGDEALQPLKEAMKVHSTNETLAEACLESMGRVKGDESQAAVLSSLKYGTPTRARIGALKAIKTRGRVTDQELDALIEILLKDKEFRVRHYLARQLIPSLNDPRFLEAVGRASRTDKDFRIRRKALEVGYRLDPGSAAKATV